MSQFLVRQFLENLWQKVHLKAFSSPSRKSAEKEKRKKTWMAIALNANARSLDKTPFLCTLQSINPFQANASSVKCSDPVHFLKPQVIFFFFISMYPFFKIFLTSKIMDETLKSSLGCSILHYYN